MICQFVSLKTRPAAYSTEICPKASTSQLEQHAFTSRDLCTNLTHPFEGRRDLLLVAARYAVREDVHAIAVIEKVQGWTAARGHTTTEVDIKLMALTRNTTHLDAHQHERLEVALVEEEEDIRRRH